MTKAPCKDCPDRKAGCHTVCKKYLEWQKVHDREFEAMRKQRDSDGMFADHIVRNVVRVNKEKRR